MQGRLNKIIKEQRGKGKQASPVDTLLSMHRVKFLKRNGYRAV